MRSLKWGALLGVLFFTGCTAKVMTYDAKGQLTGSCVAKSTFFALNATAHCYGYANPEVDYAKPNVNGVLDIPDASKQISLAQDPHGTW